MADYLVTSTADSGTGSLREAVELANGAYGADTITFDASIAGQTITLTLANGQLQLNDDVTINGDTNGDGKADITISGGGAVRVFQTGNQYTDADVVLRSLTITQGYAEFGGGAIFFGGGSLNVENSTISNSNAGLGGGLYADYTTVTIRNSLISGNTALGKGGGITNYGGNISIINSTVTLNQAGGAGGGIYKNNGGVVVGSYDIGDLIVVNSTITNNTSAGGAGGLVANGEETIDNTVIANNTNGVNPFNVSGVLEIANNNVFGPGTATVTSGGNNLFNVTATGLGGLADHGGPVLTRNIESASSVLIDRGDNGVVPVSVDSNGQPRIVGAAVDVGAVEFQGLIVVTTADDVTSNDGETSLREAVALANANADLSLIRFASNLAGQTLVLTQGELLLTTDAAIDGDTNGDNKADIAISGNNASRILHITGNTTDVDVLSLTLTNGNANFGGAIYAKGHNTLDVVDTTIRNNTATAGGGIESDYGTTRIVNSLITGNNATGYGGGGVYNFYGTMQVINSTVHANSTTGTAGGLRSKGTLSILDSTVTANAAATGTANAAASGGIFILNGTVTITNSVVADNISGNGAVENDVASTVTTATNSVFGTAVTITNNTGSTTGVANVGLGGLLDNGGTTLTRSPLDGSVLINTGLNAGRPLDALDIDNDGNTAELLPLDGRGGPRFVGPALDIGAVEQIADERITGTAAAETLLGGNGNDILRGEGGSDTLNGGIGGSDTADLRDIPANISVTLNANGDGTVAIFQVANIESLIGIENIWAGAGNDVISGNGAANTLRGGGGNDLLTGGLGLDSLYGEDGSDTVDWSAATGNIVITLSATGGGAVNVAGIGNDSISGIENIRAGSGNDTLTGNSFDNRFRGGLGNDTLNGGTGSDTADWSAANTSIVFALSATGGGVTANIAGIGIDTLTSIENLIGGSAGDTLTGNAQANTLEGGGSFDTLDGQGGIDTVDWSAASGNIVFTLSATGGGVTADVAGINKDTILNMENMIAGSGNDSLTGNGVANVLDGRGGRDTLRGGLAADTIRGGDETGAGDVLLAGDAGADRIFGGGGNDRIEGGADPDSALSGEAGNDLIAGGDGDDIADGGTENDTVYGQAGRDRLNGGLGVDTLYGGDEVGAGDILLAGDAGNDHVQGGLGNDRIDGGDGNDKLFGEGGNDTVTGGKGADRLEGGADTDVLRGEAGNDIMLGGAGIDTLYGGVNDDRLFGGADNDFLEGGNGNDNLSGEAGQDRFNFELQNGSDAVFGFVNDVDTLVIDPLFGLANAAAVLAVTIQTGNHARILLPGDGTDIFLMDYLAAGSGNTIGNLIDDILIA